MKILIVSQWYDPEPNIKCHALARSLVARGHAVQVLTSFPSYPHGKIYSGYRQRVWRREWMEGVEVFRVPQYPDHSKSAIRRVASYLSFATTACLFGPGLVKNPDVIWAYHPPLSVAAPAVLLSRIFGAPLVYEIQDMWPDTLRATGMASSPRLLRGIAWAARRVYREARAITVISDGFKKMLVSRGVPHEKIHVIPNWAMGEFPTVSQDPEFAKQHNLASRFNIVYAGNMGPAQQLQTVLDAAAGCKHLPQVQFVLIGDGVDREALIQEARSRKLDNVRFVERQPASAMPKFYAHADALLVHLKRDPLFEITIPSKTLAYLAAGKPIIAAVAGDAARVVESAGAGVLCDPENPPALCDAIQDLVKQPSATREAMGRAGRRVYEEEFTVDVLVDRYEALFAELNLKYGHAKEF